MSKKKQILSPAGYGVLGIILILVAALSFQVAHDLLHDVTYFGTWRAPHSDALAPWLHGALNYLFYGEPHGYLYRPTIGVFFGSILGAAGRIDAIPVFFLTSLLAFLLLAILAADQKLRLALVAWLVFVVVNYAGAIQSLNVGNLMPDVPALVFTLAGLYFIFRGIHATPADHRLLWAGFLVIGIAAAIRGPMMLAGPAMLLTLYAITAGEGRARLLIPATVLFALPILVDVVSQRAYGVVNNGIMTLYCFYTEPSSSWTSACQTRYMEIKPSVGVVLGGYLQTFFSEKGFAVVVGNLSARLYLDGVKLMSAGFWGSFAIAALWVLSSVVRKSSQRGTQTEWAGWIREVLAGRYYALPRIIVIPVAGLLAFERGPQAFLVTLSAITALMSAVMRLNRPLIGIITYWFGAVFLALMTQAQQERLGLTFSFALFLALILFICDQPRAQESDSGLRHTRWLASAATGVVLFLYLGVFLLPSELRVIYKSQVEGKTTALKISEDRVFDRCLYFTGARELAYVTCDDAPIGSVRQYSKLDAPGGLWNGSYAQPARFVP